MPPHVDLMLAAANLPVLVGYGLTEASPVVAVRRLERNVIGTIGVPLSGTEVRTEEPEPGAAATLRVRGPQVMAGYWNDPAATSRVLGGDGWFETGDVIRLTSSGDLVFCGRAKDTIVLLGGENVEPEPLEQAIAACPWIEQVVVLGQDEKALGALVWPARGSPLEGDVAAAAREVLARTGSAAGFRPWETIHRVRLLPEPLSADDQTLTATLKVRRGEVLRRHAGLVRDLFRSA
jgi:long-chain acyl-CoA synthetase